MQSPLPSDSPPRAGRPLVLVVDDNDTNRLVLSHCIDALGGDVLMAQHGAAALEMLADAQVDLVLMDIAMPVMDGLEATRRLREAGFARPIIAVTAQMGADDLPRLRSAGFDDLIEKPISAPAIAQALAQAVVAGQHGA